MTGGQASGDATAVMRRRSDLLEIRGDNGHVAVMDFSQASQTAPPISSPPLSRQGDVKEEDVKVEDDTGEGESKLDALLSLPLPLSLSPATPLALPTDSPTLHPGGPTAAAAATATATVASPAIAPTMPASSSQARIPSLSPTQVAPFPSPTPYPSISPFSSPSPPPLASSLSPEQQHFLSLVSSGRNVFLTGCAGTGKSYALERAVGTLR